MAKPIIYKCRYKHCQHESYEISQDEAVRIGTRYFHKDCAETYQNIEEIKRLYYEKISNTVVMAQLVKAVNSVVFDKHVDSAFVLFALKYAINTKHQIKSPYTLHYLVDNYKIKDAWEKKKSNDVKNVKFEAKKSESPTFHAVKPKEKSLGNLFD